MHKMFILTSLVLVFLRRFHVETSQNTMICMIKLA